MSVRTQRNSLPLLSLGFKETKLTTDWYEYYRDDFDDVDVGDEWILHNTDANRTIEEDADILTITSKVGVDSRWFWTYNEAPKAYMTIPTTPPLQIIAKVNAFTLEDNHMAGIWIGYYDAILGGSEAWLFGPRKTVAQGTGIGAYLVPSGHSSTKVVTPPTPQYLKIEVDEDEVITFWYGTNGVDWTQYQYFEAGDWHDLIVSGWFAEDMEIGMFAQNMDWPPQPEISAPFEFFLINVYEARRVVTTENLAPIDTRSPDRFYRGRIKQMSTLKRAVDDKTGLFQIADMSITLANADKHYSQKMVSHILKNQEATLYHAWTDEAEALKMEIIKLIVEDHSMKGPDFTIKLKDITQKYFTKKVPANTCTKEGIDGVDAFPNIHPDHEGRYMPEILGNASLSAAYEHPGAVEAVYVDMNNGVAPFRCLASAGTVFIPPVNEVWVADVPKSEGVHYDITFLGGRTYIDFYDGQDPGDDTVAFNAHGYSLAAWDSTNGYIQNLAYIIQYYLRYIMGIPASLINAASFGTLASHYEEMGVHLNGYLIIQNRTDAMEILRQLLFTGGAKGFMALDGKFEVARKNLCNWQVPEIERHIFEQIELFGSPERQWNLTSAVNTVNVQFGRIPWQNLYTGAKREFVDNDYEAGMEEDISLPTEFM